MQHPVPGQMTQGQSQSQSPSQSTQPQTDSVLPGAVPHGTVFPGPADPNQLPRTQIPRTQIPQAHISPSQISQHQALNSQDPIHPSPSSPGAALRAAQNHLPQEQRHPQHWDSRTSAGSQYCAATYAGEQGQTAMDQPSYPLAQPPGHVQATQAQITQAEMAQARAAQLGARRSQPQPIHASSIQASRAQAAAQAAVQAAAMQYSARGSRASDSSSRLQPDYGPAHPSHYLQREAAAQAATQALAKRYTQPYGNQAINQTINQAINQTNHPFQGSGTEGWTGVHPHGNPPRRQARSPVESQVRDQQARGQQDQLPRPNTFPRTAMAQRRTMRPAPIPRRYRNYLEEDFVPDFGPSRPLAGNASPWSLPVINWQNWPLGSTRFWTALGGIIFAAIMLNVLGTSPVISSIVKRRNRQCQEVVQPNSVLSRQQLTQLLTVPERSPKTSIQDIIRQPYCTLSSLNIRAGVDAVREAYPLEFDPDIWIVVLYEGDEYAGYRFNTR